MWSPGRRDGATKIIGPAYTVEYVPLDDPAPKHPTHYVSYTLLILISLFVLTESFIDRFNPLWRRCLHLLP